MNFLGIGPLLDGLALAAPALVFAWRIRMHPRQSVPNIIVGFYVYGLLALSAVSSPDYAPPALLIGTGKTEVLRIVIITIWTAQAIVVVASSRLRIRSVRAAFWACMTMVGMLVSLAVNPGAGASSALLRLVLTAVVTLNLFILIPTLARREGYFEEMRKATILLAYLLTGVSVYMLAAHGAFPRAAIRLGRPLSPGLLGYIAVVAFGLTYLGPTRLATRIGLFVIVVGTASRTALMGAVAVALFMELSQKRYRVRRIISLGLIACVGGLLYVGFVEQKLSGRVSPFTRATLASGRQNLWAVASQKIHDKPVFGAGQRVEILEKKSRNEGDSNDVRAHNLLLETAMSFGIPTALVAGGVYISLFLSMRRLRWHRAFGFVMVGVATSRIFVTTSSWLNLGDGTNVLMMAFIVPLAWTGTHRGRMITANEVSDPAHPMLPVPVAAGSGNGNGNDGGNGNGKGNGNGNENGQGGRQWTLAPPVPPNRDPRLRPL